MIPELFGIALGSKLIDNVRKYKEHLAKSTNRINKIRRKIDKAKATENQKLLQETKTVYNNQVARYNQEIVEKWMGFFAKRNKFDKIQFYDAPEMEQADKEKDGARRKKMLKRGLLMLIPVTLLLSGIFSAIAEQNLYLFFGGLIVTAAASIPGLANVIYALCYASRKT